MLVRCLQKLGSHGDGNDDGAREGAGHADSS